MTCQRCHEAVRDADRYCPVCGLPQLMYLPAEAPVIPLGETDMAANAGEPLGLAGGIAWRPALKTALMLAVPAAFLCFGVLPIGILGMGGAGAWAVSIYTRQARTGRISAGDGSRIGLVTGVLASWLTFGLFGLELWIDRFVRHTGGEWDSMWQAQVDGKFQTNQQMVAQMGTASAQAAQLTQSMRNLMLSIEGRAGWAISGLVLVALLLVSFATIGGAIGARFMANPRQPNA